MKNWLDTKETKIQDELKTFIVAEAGANHNQNYEQALALVDVAVSAKADAVKFQTYSSDTLYSKNTPDFAGYKNIPKLIKDIELPRVWHRDLKLYCDDNGIEFMSTPFDVRAVDELYNLGIKRFKIAGFEATDPRFVKYVASTGLPLIISAGIGTNLKMIESIISWVDDVNPKPDITILHCNNAYPTPFEDISLLQVKAIQERFPNVNSGLSDHTRGILIPPLAVSLGAKCIEKHYTLSRVLPGPDHPFAIEPDELKQMIENIRTTEKALTLKEKNFTTSELNFRKAMRSVVAKHNIKKGEVFTVENLTTKRPCLETSIPAYEFYEILGKKANQDIGEDDIIMRKMV